MLKIWGIIVVLSSMLLAEPTSGKVKINNIRPYHSSNNVVFIEVSNSSFCNTNVFKIINDKQMYSAALAAMMSDKDVKIEVIDSTGCSGWGTILQSIYIYK